MCICRGSAIANSLSQITLCLLLYGYIRWKKLHQQTWGGQLYTKLKITNTEYPYPKHFQNLNSPQAILSHTPTHQTLLCETLQAGPLTVCKSGAPS